MTEIRTIEELAAELGVERADQIARRLYKDTDCGISFRYEPPLNTSYGSVTVCGYAEGSDASLPAHTLNFPFTAEEFWAAVKAADQEGCDEWHDANEPYDE